MRTVRARTRIPLNRLRTEVPIRMQETRAQVWTSLTMLLLAAFSLARPAGAQDGAAVGGEAATLHGIVVDESGAALPSANVWVRGTTLGVVTDSTGRFELRVDTRETPYVIVASSIGYERAQATVTVRTSNPDPVKLQLQKNVIEIDEVVVSTSTYTTGIEEGVTLDPFDVVTTPGAAADVFRAVQTFPGVSAVDKGSGLFVRGGNTSETVTLIDHATVTHPYKYESPTTSTFGTLPPFLVEGTSFSAGGFSARYGNALSGVLDMTSQGYPNQRSFYGNLSLAATSVGVDYPITDDLGVRFSGNRSFTELLFWVNGSNNEFSRTPQSVEANLNVIYDYSDTGTLKLFNFLSTSRLGVRVEEPGFSSTYRDETVNWLHNLYWTDELGAWRMEVNAGATRHRSEQTYGSLRLEPRDDQYKLRVDARRPVSDAVTLRTGAEVVNLRTGIAGAVPSESTHSGSDPIPLDDEGTGYRAGGYAKVKAKIAQRIAGRLGVRTDAHTLAETVVADPRASLRYLFSESTDLRLAWGIYHQFPEPNTFNETADPEALGAQRAQHLIAGIEHRTDRLHLRVEGYYKSYDDLVIERSPSIFTNQGRGWAAGGDIFLTYGDFLDTPVYGRLAYSYLQSKRRQPRRLGSRVVLESGPSPYEITHNVTAVINATVPGRLPGTLGRGYLSGGLTIRHATGKPVTPVVDAVQAPDAGYFLPIEGPVGADRLPPYRRVDAQINYYVPLGSQNTNVVFYASVNNVLGRTNVLDYVYSPDYSSRTVQKTNFERSFYFGVNVDLGL